MKRCKLLPGAGRRSPRGREPHASKAPGSRGGGGRVWTLPRETGEGTRKLEAAWAPRGTPSSPENRRGSAGPHQRRHSPQTWALGKGPGLCPFARGPQCCSAASVTRRTSPVRHSSCPWPPRGPGQQDSIWLRMSHREPRCRPQKSSRRRRWSIRSPFHLLAVPPRPPGSLCGVPSGRVLGSGSENPECSNPENLSLFRFLISLPATTGFLCGLEPEFDLTATCCVPQRGWAREDASAAHPRGRRHGGAQVLGCREGRGPAACGGAEGRPVRLRRPEVQGGSGTRRTWTTGFHSEALPPRRGSPAPVVEPEGPLAGRWFWGTCHRG